MIYNIDFLLAALIFLMVIMHHFMTRRTMDFGHNQSFFWLIAACFLNICLDLLCTVLISLERPELAALTELCLVFLYLLQLLVPSLLLYHIMAQFTLKPQFKLMRIVIAVLPVLMAFVLVLNHWNGLFFTVTADGVYLRGPLYMLMYLFAALYLIAILICTIIHRADLPAPKLHAIYELLIISGVVVALQGIQHDILLTGFGITLGITVLFFTLDNPYHYTDSLTDTFDVHYFRDRIQYRMDAQKNIHIVAVKLKHLKRINMMMGSDAGNELLVETSRLLKESDRKNLVFRVSGNEFAVMTGNSEQCEAVCRRVMDHFSSAIEMSEKKVKCPVSVCTIHNAEKLESSDQLLSYMEYLLAARSKNSETCLVEDCVKTLQGFRRNQEIESYLETAVEQDLFETVYQPIYSIQKKKFVAIEVLSRLRHPELGWISPMVFITMAEKNGQVGRIGLLQLHRVCRFLKEHPEIMNSIDNVKFNLSPAELIKSDHVTEIIQIIEGYGLPLPFFQFEITETAATEYSEVLAQVFDDCADRGVKLCMDDFGSGFSNLNTVMKFPFAVIKLDRSLLFGICDDERIAALYRSLITTFHNLGYSVVSEGVETEEETRLVSGWGTDMIQGYYYSRPLTAQGLLELIGGKKETEE